MSSLPFPFPIIVLGDSILWGQGLRPTRPGVASDKMAELVGAALNANPTVVGAWTAGAGLAVSVSRFAHSGAMINATLASPPTTITTPVTATTPFPAGEVPAPAPTILDQVAGAVAALSAATPPVAASAVNLVIVDGGINDVGLFTSILNPLANPLTIAARTNAACGGALTVLGAAALAPPVATAGQMSALLAAVGKAFPSAVIVVTGYYDIISLFSDLTGLVIAVGVLSGSIVPGLLESGGWVASVLAGSTAAATAQAVVSANCAAFTATANGSLTSAVALANAAPGGSFSAQGVTAPRFIFVPSPFAPVNALFTLGSNGADETTATAPAFLWGFNPSLDLIGAVIDSSIGTGATVGGILGFLTGTDIFGAGVGSSVGALAGAAVAIGLILPTLSAVDEVVAFRAGPTGACAGTPPGLFGTGVLPCNLASVGHPNIEGEAAYVAAIAPPLITMFGTTLPALGIIAVASAASSAGCLIVTAALGSPQAEQVERLCKLRDEFIWRSRRGRDVFAAASREYYAFSPIIAARMRASAEFKDRVRCFAVSPFLGFVELLGSWLAGLSADKFQEVLRNTLDASLKDLANLGLAGGQVAAAAEEISRMSVHRAQGATPITAETDAWGQELSDVVNYFNAVAGRNVPNEGAYVDVLVLQPLKLYWRLLRIRAASTSLADIRCEFDAGITHWLASTVELASLSHCSADELLADLQVLCDLLCAKQSARQIFAASLLSDDRETKPQGFEARQEYDCLPGAGGRTL